MEHQDWEDMREWDREAVRHKNNRQQEPVGHWTGRCKRCHSTDLWDDVSAYGCNCCGAIFFTG